MHFDFIRPIPELEKMSGDINDYLMSFEKPDTIFYMWSVSPEESSFSTGYGTANNIRRKWDEYIACNQLDIDYFNRNNLYQCIASLHTSNFRWHRHVHIRPSGEIIKLLLIIFHTAGTFSFADPANESLGIVESNRDFLVCSDDDAQSNNNWIMPDEVDAVNISSVNVMPGDFAVFDPRIYHTFTTDDPNPRISIFIPIETDLCKLADFYKI